MLFLTSIVPELGAQYLRAPHVELQVMRQGKERNALRQQQGRNPFSCPVTIFWQERSIDRGSHWGLRWQISVALMA